MEHNALFLQGMSLCDNPPGEIGRWNPGGVTCSNMRGNRMFSLLAVGYPGPASWNGLCIWGLVVWWAVGDRYDLGVL